MAHNMEHHLPNNLNISFSGVDGVSLLINMDNIAVSNGSACGSGNIKPSPILTAIGVDEVMNLSTLRFSFGSSNTSEDIEYLLAQLKSILS